MPLEQPFRLKLPSPDARVARSPFPDGLVFEAAEGGETHVVFVPIVQWSNIRIRGRVNGTGGVMGREFDRPNRALDPALLQGASEAFVYTVDQPADDGTAWFAGTDFVLEITAAEHQGENWLKITLDSSGGGDLVYLDISGTLLGTFH